MHGPIKKKKKADYFLSEIVLVYLQFKQVKF